MKYIKYNRKKRGNKIYHKELLFLINIMYHLNNILFNIFGKY